MNDLIIVADGFRAFQKKSRDVKLVRQLEKLGTSESLLLAAQIRQQHIKKEDDLPKVFAAYKRSGELGSNMLAQAHSLFYTGLCYHRVMLGSCGATRVAVHVLVGGIGRQSSFLSCHTLKRRL